MTVGFVGLGHMGLPMAQRVIGAGHELRGFDASEIARSHAASQGVMIARDLEAIALECEVVMLSLPSSDVVDVVADALLEVESPVLRTIIDTSSSVPERTRSLAERAALRGVDVLDAPVSGGVPRAIDGTLTVMVGGDGERIGDVQPLLDAIGARVHTVGPVGAGHAVKALNNLLSAAHLLASCEALVTAEAFGVDPAVFVDVVNSSSGRSGSTELKLPRYVLPRDWSSGFSAALLQKDARIAADLETAAGLSEALGVAVAERWAALAAQLDAGADHTEIVVPIERERGIESAEARP